jgi:hypothetical protein
MFQFEKRDLQIQGASLNRELLVVNPAWKHTNQNPFAVSLQGNTLLLGADKTHTATLLYPSSTGGIRQARLNFVVYKIDFTRNVFGRTTFTIPTDCDSGVGLIVGDDGKYIPISLDKSDHGLYETTNLLFGIPNSIKYSDLNGRNQLFPVPPLTNVRSVNVSVTVNDELEGITQSKAIEYVTSNLREECPRLNQASSSDKQVEESPNGYTPKNKVDRQSILNVYGNYIKIPESSLILNLQRDKDGLYIVDLMLLGNAVTNGGFTTVILYRDYTAGVNRFDSDTFRDILKKMIRKFSDRWVSENPRDQST